ncbi:MAG: tRNA pseudouridine38-40 synthase [Solirubrobacterales bacterium]|jgi:tRNA pseudouridine38-40 synthase|nr:tRNA pseudouridine38-40 synthase [Solirubrobacterales bacterium]
MASFKLTIAYEGTGFSGWSRQPGLRTVQQVLEEGVAQILSGTPVELTVAGRTDAGVHALSQVASFELDREAPDRFASRINAVLPRDVSVLACEEAPEGFDARRWAVSRRYRYRILTTEQRTPFEDGRALWWPYPLDHAALDECAAAIAGEHDFTAFTPTQTEHVRFERRVISAAWEDECEAVLVFDITADAFMRSMIRVLVGTMLEVGAGKRSVEDFASLLERAPRERAGDTAPPHGLYLVGVTYGDGPAFEHGEAFE